MTDERYVPDGDARFAAMNLWDPWRPDSDGWVPADHIEAQRGHWQGSDDADFIAGLVELIEEGWAERDADRDAYRLTATGRHVCETRLGLK